METNRRTGFFICTFGSFIFWGLVLLTCSCGPRLLIHEPELIVVSIDVNNGLVLMQGVMVRPKGFYYVQYPIENFQNAQLGMKYTLLSR